MKILILLGVRVIEFDSFLNKRLMVMSDKPKFGIVFIWKDHAQQYYDDMRKGYYRLSEEEFITLGSHQPSLDDLGINYVGGCKNFQTFCEENDVDVDISYDEYYNWSDESKNIMRKADDPERSLNGKKPEYVLIFSTQNY